MIIVLLCEQENERKQRHDMTQNNVIMHVYHVEENNATCLHYNLDSPLSNVIVNALNPQDQAIRRVGSLRTKQRRRNMSQPGGVGGIKMGNLGLLISSLNST